MRNSLLLIVGFIIASFGISSAQELAITESGDSIYIYDDGTWVYEFGDEKPTLELFGHHDFIIDTLDLEKVAPDNATKTFKSKKAAFEVKYDPSKFKRIPAGQINSEAEMVLQAIDAEVFAMAIIEEGEVGSENLVAAAIDNAKATGGELSKIEAATYQLNGEKIVYSKWHMDLGGMKIVFCGHYFSDQRGTVQFMAWTTENIYSKYEALISEVLNGLVVSQTKE